MKSFNCYLIVVFFITITTFVDEAMTKSTASTNSKKTSTAFTKTTQAPSPPAPTVEAVDDDALSNDTSATLMNNDTEAVNLSSLSVAGPKHKCQTEDDCPKNAKCISSPFGGVHSR